jgi:acetyl esterase/lipase
MHRLYYSPGSCSMAAHIVLEEIGAPYELQLISSLGATEGKMTATSDWKAVNPKGRVPALLGVPGRIGGAENLLTELHAILIFLARTHPSVGLLPTDPAGEARCIEWMNWLASNGNSGAKFLANEGFVTASLSYRLSGVSPFPAAIEDCKCAIRFLRKNALNYGINPDKIGVAGSSAGGHLAELVATANKAAGLEGTGGWQDVSSRVQAAASYYGVSDFTARFPQETDEFIEKFLRGTEKRKGQLYRKASPIFYVSKDDPPLLIVHGDKDNSVPFDQSVRIIEAYRRVGLPVEFIAVKNAGHDFEQVGNAPISPSVELIHQRTSDFFKRFLSY